MKVFLGGTCNESTWRDELIPLLKINYFNPVVEDWTPECQAEEERQKLECDFLLYVITPKMTGVFAIAEAVHDSIRRTEKTLFCVLGADEDIVFDEGQLKSLKAVADLIELQNVPVFVDLDDIADHLNANYTEVIYDKNVMECLIIRDGTNCPVTMKNHKYIFKANENGDKVCLVQSDEHKRSMEKLGIAKVYRADLVPKAEFTYEEEEFIKKWSLMDLSNFRAYINGHMPEFDASRDKIKQIAIGKWDLMEKQSKSHVQTRFSNPSKNIQECPIVIVKKQKKRKPLEKIIETKEIIETKDEAPGLTKISDIINKNKTDLDNDPKAVTEEKALEAVPYKTWQNMKSDDFETYFMENGEYFSELPADLYTKAKDKWVRVIKKPWPIDEG